MQRFLIPLFFLLIFSGVSPTLAFSVPSAPTGWVNDYTGILSTEDKTALENKIASFERATTHEIAVVIVSSLDGDVIENVAQEIFEEWGLGKEGKDNGVLILISMGDRKTRIQTGYGVEGDLTDIETSYIQSDIIAPSFREENYFTGLDGAVDKIIESLGGAEIVPPGYQTEEENGGWEVILVFLFFFFQWIVAILGRSKSWWGGGVLGGVVGAIIWAVAAFPFIGAFSLFVFLILFGLGLDYAVSRAYQKSKALGQNYPWWIGGGRGGGFGGGGFSGFGGGHSGGGGSSGGW